MTFVPGHRARGDAQGRVWFLFGERGLAVRDEGGTIVLPTDVAIAAHEDAHYLGELDGRQAFAAAMAAPEGFKERSLRSLFGSVSEEMLAVAGRASHVIDWATSSRFCGRCATPNVRDENERAMRCPKCGLTAYPRISPAVIVLVRRGEEALLARGARFPLPFYSTLAGFSEIGESLEDTLKREVREEVGIEIDDIRYFGSQPWPFPNSLMIGFFANYAGGELKPDPSEIVDAKWFRRDELPMMPPPFSIARQLIDVWINGTPNTSG